MKIHSLAFAEKQPIPTQYTCDGADISPPLYFEDIPENTKSLALIMHDPDAPKGDFTHWIAWNIDSAALEIDEDQLPGRAVEGITDFGTTGYGGPCPPSGTHRYLFELYALDIMLSLTSTATRADLEEAMSGHILEQATLTGTYQLSIP